MINYSVHQLEVSPGKFSAVHRFCKEKSSRPLLLVHGSIENGRIFYSKSGKGFAYYMAEKGYDVFVVDQIGKGESKPTIKKGFYHTQSELINRDIPAYVSYIREIYPTAKICFGAHSWGGVILMAWYARHGKTENCGPMVFFGSKRRISVFSFKRFFYVDIMWTLVGTMASEIKGFLPAKKLGMGSDNEPRLLFQQVNKWVYSSKWIDATDGFNYAEAIEKVEVPPVLYVAAINDKVLGNPTDVEIFMKETKSDSADYLLLAKNNGNMQDYDHINMLTHKDCREDHFPIILKWLESNSVIYENNKATGEF